MALFTPKCASTGQFGLFSEYRRLRSWFSFLWFVNNFRKHPTNYSDLKTLLFIICDLRISRIAYDDTLWSSCWNSGLLWFVTLLAIIDEISKMPSSSYVNLPEPSVFNRSRGCNNALQKCTLYFHRLFRVNQMDFEFAFWQMVYLFLNPKKV